MSFICERTIAALKERGTEQLADYETALLRASVAHPPPFGQRWYGDKYRSVAIDPEWMAASLIANAEKEGEGSRKLWSLAGRIQNPQISDAVRRHAIDESRHSLLYVAICDLVFPGALDGQVREFAQSLSPRFTAQDSPPQTEYATKESVIDELIQMNIGEIRTMIHQFLMRPVIIAHCPDTVENRLSKALDTLMLDEVSHIKYTAQLVDQAARTGSRDFVNVTFADRLREFNGITLNEVGEDQFIGT